jgi:hypothetical protein
MKAGGIRGLSGKGDEMVCTKCEWEGLVRAGEFKDWPWEETPCARCVLKEDSTETLAYDDNRPPLEEGYAGGTADAEDPLLPASVLADALRLFLALPRDALDVIHLRYGGMPYREIAAKLGVGTGAVEMRHKRVLEKVTALKELFTKKAWRRAAWRRMREREKKLKTEMLKAEKRERKAEILKEGGGVCGGEAAR